MPEGPELHLASQFINNICKDRVFAGKVRKNPIHKCSDVVWDSEAYTISAISRGKELQLCLQSLKAEKDPKPLPENDILETLSESLHIFFSFGMSGKFEFTSSSKMPKHAHLSFFTKTQPSMALSFVDRRRFGKWQVGGDWSSTRGPCVLFEYEKFRSHVLSSLTDAVFNKPVCEVLLNQKYFNGIGNYLRAEICYRAGVRPFEQARAVFAALPDVPKDVKIKIMNELKETVKIKTETKPDILELCNMIPLEVVDLGTSLYFPEEEDSHLSKFGQWLQCYCKSGMNNVPDHNNRTMWYHGDAGPLMPKEKASRKRHWVPDKKLTQTVKKIKKELQDDICNKRSQRAKSRKQDRTDSSEKGTNSQVVQTSSESLLKKSQKRVTRATNGRNVDIEITKPFDNSAQDHLMKKKPNKKDRTKIQVISEIKTDLNICIPSTIKRGSSRRKDKSPVTVVEEFRAVTRRTKKSHK